MRIARLLLCFAAGLIVGCSGQSTGSVPVSNDPSLGPGMSDQSILRYLPQQISMSDKLALYPALAALPEKHRQNVIFYDASGHEHTNIVGITGLPSRGEYVPAPAATSTFPPCKTGDVGGCTGVLYQHRGSSGYGYFSSTTNVPCASTIIDTSGTTYQANVYVTIKGTQPLELGLQYNANQSNAVTSVQPYFSDAGTQSNPNGNPHLTCDQQNMQLEAFITQSSATSPAYGVMDIQGGFTAYMGTPSICGTAATCNAVLEMMTALKSADKLTQTCVKCSISWTTAIAVPQNGPQQLAGSKFGIDQNCDPQIVWNSVTQGSFSTYGSNAAATTTKWIDASIAKSPTTAVNPLNIVRVADNSSGSTYNELIGIDETGNSCLQGSFH